MKFLELNKKRHATKHFTDKPVDPKDVRTAIEIATLAPSAHNSQPWKFVVVREKNAELAKLAYGSNFETVGYTDDKLEPSYRLPVDEIIEKR
ncbi:nitroreductase [Streptococcus pneumoniae]|nr:nitroreductase [Streptococcus pneumoniae]